MRLSILLFLIGALLLGASVAQQCQQARVLGAGVVGILSAIQLQKLGFNVTIHAYASPLQNSDYAWYASPHAGAWWSGNWNEDSYPSYSALMGMTVSEPLSTAITRPASVFYVTAPTNPSEMEHQKYADYFRNFTAAELGVYGSLFSYGYEMTAVMVSAPDYTKFLLNRFLENGGNLIHQNITRLSDLANMPNTDLVVSAPGLGARWLGDVEDSNVYPQRGQTLIMRNPEVTRIYRGRGPVDSSDPGNFGTYILPRHNGDIVVGGTRQDNDWDTSVRQVDTDNIMRRAAILHAPIANATIVKFNVGFRPGRTGGLRVELDNNFKVPVIHHYGHAGAGFEESWGSTFRAMKIVQTRFPSLSSCPRNTPSTPAPSTPAPSTPTPAPTAQACVPTAVTSSAAGRLRPWWMF